MNHEPRPRPKNTVQPSAEQRARVLARDGARCLFCGSTHRLELHHRPEADSTDFYPRPTDPLDSDFATFCHTCHAILTAEVQMKPRHEGRLDRITRTNRAIVETERVDTNNGRYINRTIRPAVQVERHR